VGGEGRQRDRAVRQVRNPETVVTIRKPELRAALKMVTEER
jgi:hypothetical protein